MKEKLLAIRNLTVHYSVNDTTVEAVNGLNLTLEQGESLGLVGETGAGKTTTALAVMQLVPDPPGKIVSGSVIYKGIDLTKLNKKEIRKIRGKEISMIFQDPMTSLNPVLTVGDQIMEVIMLHEHLSYADATLKTQKMLELVGIPAVRYDNYPHQFSGGMKQRVVIACALACSPQLIIADEPTTALDVTIQAQVLDLMNNLKKEFNTAMLLITHDLGVVVEACDNVAVMYAGTIVEYGSVKMVFKNRLHPYTIGLFGSLPHLDGDAARLNPIPGMMPDPSALPKGCAFVSRCKHAFPRCGEERPLLRERIAGHFAACHYLDANEAARGDILP